jgi:hypothetical protein
MSFEDSALKQRMRAHSWLIVLLAILAVAPIGWSIFWFVKSRTAAAAVTAWMAQEARQGRVWSCPSQTIGGFPYNIAISCENLAFQGEAFGKSLSGTIHGFRATSPLLRNDNVLVKLEPPFTAKSSGGDLDISAQWSELLVEFEGTPGVNGQLAFMGSQIGLQGVALGTDATGSTFGDVNGYFARSAGRQDQAYDVLVSFHQGQIHAIRSRNDAGHSRGRGNVCRHARKVARGEWPA